MNSINKVTRINLKPGAESRSDLIRYCLFGEKQYIAIGWSGAFEVNPEIKTYEEYYYAVKEKYRKKYNHVHNVFRDAKEGFTKLKDTTLKTHAYITSKQNIFGGKPYEKADFPRI